MASNNSKRNMKPLIIAAIAVILVVAIALCVVYFAFPDVWARLHAALFGEPLEQGENTLSVYFMDVGQGDCIYIAFPDGDDMLIDCGNKSSDYNFNDTMAYLNRLNPDGNITHLMLTHTDEDHVEYLDDIIRAYDIDNIYMPNILAKPKSATAQAAVNALGKSKLSMFTDEDTVETEVYANFFIAALSEKGCTIHLNMDEDERSNSIIISDGSTYTLTFYCPTAQYYADTNLNSALRLNAVSPVGILTYNGRRVVLTGDSNKYNEPIVADRIGYLDCDVLKVAHHGSETSSTDEFLRAVNCEYAIISCNEHGNTFHHPTQEALDRFIARNMTIYRTDNNGTIVLSIDGDGNMSFDMEREATQQQNRKGAAA